MRLLVDAQLPVRLASRLDELLHDVLHTSSLPDGNRTTDQQIAALADRDGRVVVTKDADFRNSHLLTGSPAKLLVVATGNIGNDDLLQLFELRLTEIEGPSPWAIMSNSGAVRSYGNRIRSLDISRMRFVAARIVWRSGVLSLPPASQVRTGGGSSSHRRRHGRRMRHNLAHAVPL